MFERRKTGSRSSPAPRTAFLTSPSLGASLLDTLAGGRDFKKKGEGCFSSNNKDSFFLHRRPKSKNQPSFFLPLVTLHPLAMASPAERVAEALVPERAEHEVRVEKTEREREEEKREKLDREHSIGVEKKLSTFSLDLSLSSTPLQLLRASPPRSCRSTSTLSRLLIIPEPNFS